MQSQLFFALFMMQCASIMYSFHAYALDVLPSLHDVVRSSDLVPQNPISRSLLYNSFPELLVGRKLNKTKQPHSPATSTDIYLLVSEEIKTISPE